MWLWVVLLIGLASFALIARLARRRARPQTARAPDTAPLRGASLEALGDEMARLNAGFFGVRDERERKRLHLRQRIRAAFDAQAPVGWVADAIAAEGARGEVFAGWALGAPSRPSIAPEGGGWDGHLAAYAGAWWTALGDDERLLMQVHVRPRESPEAPVDVVLETRWLLRTEGGILRADPRERRAMVVGRPSAARVELQDPMSGEALSLITRDGAPALGCPHLDGALVLSRGEGPYR